MSTDFLFAMKEKILLLLTFFNSYFRILLFDYFPFVWWKLNKLATALVCDLLFNYLVRQQTLSTESLSDDQDTNT
jgi:hypothetical protein